MNYDELFPNNKKIIKIEKPPTPCVIDMENLGTRKTYVTSKRQVVAKEIRSPNNKNEANNEQFSSHRNSKTKEDAEKPTSIDNHLSYHSYRDSTHIKPLEL